MDRRELLKKSALGIGITLTGPAISTILNSCSPSRAPLSWKPKVLTENQARTIGSIADTILPKTDIPGALDLKLDRFVDVMISIAYSSEDKNQFTTELDVFMKECQSQYGGDFQDCSDDQKSEIIQDIERKSNKTTSQVWGKNIAEVQPIPFYRKLKGLIITGYYTSEDIGKNVLSYDPVPGKQLGCIPLSEVGNSWTEG